MFRFETTQKVENTNYYRAAKDRASLLSSRVKIIEVCTESFFQPLFQLYIVYMSLMNWVLGEGMVTSSRENDDHFHLIINQHWREMLSICISILSLSWGYTSHYRRSKEGALDTLATLAYFGSTLLFVIARILSFQLFAYYLGPGNFVNAMITVGIHVLLMSVIDFIFSYSIEQCQNLDANIEMYSRELCLGDFYHCLINGLANIFVYNHIVNNTFVSKNYNCKSHVTSFKHQGQDQGPYSSKASIWMIEEYLQKEPSKVPKPMFDLNPSNKGASKHQHTLVRQFIVETILLLENVAMVILARTIVTARKTPFDDIYNLTLLCIVVSYSSAMFIKILYYSFCHPWSELIRINFVSSFVNK